ncbi:MAG: hypothetical protein ACFCGT_19680 [Sandaracinaceae bacterium]
MDLLALLTLLVLAGVVGGSWVLARQEDGRLLEGWEALASHLGARVVRPRGPLLSPAFAAMEVERGGSRVVVEACRGPLGRPVTRARARYALGEGPVFAARPVGRGDVDRRRPADAADPTPSFDEAYALRTGDRAGARAVLGPVDKAAFRTVLSGASLLADGSEVRVTLPRPTQDPVVLWALIDVTAELAEHGARQLRALADQLPESRWRDAGDLGGDGAPRLVVDTVAGPVEVLVRARSAPRVALRVSAPRTHASGRASAPEVEAHLAELGTGRLHEGDGELSIRWDGVPPAADLGEGVLVLRLLAGGSTRRGVFR